MSVSEPAQPLEPLEILRHRGQPSAVIFRDMTDPQRKQGKIVLHVEGADIQHSDSPRQPIDVPTFEAARAEWRANKPNTAFFGPRGVIDLPQADGSTGLLITGVETDWASHWASTTQVEQQPLDDRMAKLASDRVIEPVTSHALGVNIQLVGPDGVYFFDRGAGFIVNYPDTVSTGISRGVFLEEANRGDLDLVEQVLATAQRDLGVEPNELVPVTDGDPQVIFDALIYEPNGALTLVGTARTTLTRDELQQRIDRVQEASGKQKFTGVHAIALDDTNGLRNFLSRSAKWAGWATAAAYFGLKRAIGTEKLAEIGGNGVLDVVPATVALNAGKSADQNLGGLGGK